MGPLAEAISACGLVHWHPLPPPPKPWQETTVSPEQATVLREVMQRAAGEISFDRDAERLLFERLGFAPRLLATEARKLAAAARGGRVDEPLVRRLSFPKERSLEAARDAVLERRAAPLLDVLLAAEGGHPVRDFRGQLMGGKSAAFALVNQAWSLFQQMLYLRVLAGRHGLLDEMSPELTAHSRWYPNRFKDRIAPRLQELLEDDAPSPVVRPEGRVPSPFVLSHLFRAAGRYRDVELTRALADLGEVETALRSDHWREAVSAFFSRVLPDPAAE
jgi:DNA polymerase III delta subunit